VNLPPEYTYRIYGHKQLGSPIDIGEVKANNVDGALYRWSEIHNKEYRTWHDIAVYKNGQAVRVYHHDVGLKVPPTYAKESNPRYERIEPGATSGPAPQAAAPATVLPPLPATAAPAGKKILYKTVCGITVREA
jgi:hypothetical protein